MAARIDCQQQWKQACKVSGDCGPESARVGLNLITLIQFANNGALIVRPAGHTQAANR